MATRSTGRWYRVGALVGSVLLSALNTHAARADEKADKLLKEVISAYKGLQTLTAEFSIRQQLPGIPASEMTGTVKAKKPNLFAIDSSGTFPALMTSDGKMVLVLLKLQKAYSQLPVSGQSMNMTTSTVVPLTFFFNPEKLTLPDTPTAYIGQETWNDTLCDVVEQKTQQEKVSTVMRYYITPAKLVARVKIQVDQMGRKIDIDAVLTKVQLDTPLAATEFPTLPPKDAHLLEIPVLGGKSVTLGQDAPDFTLPTPTAPPATGAGTTTPAGGDKVSLKQALKDKKAVLVTFWFQASEVCREGLPRLQALYAEFKAKGLEIVAINSNDDRETIKSYLKQAGLTFPIGMDDVGEKHYEIAKAYGVGVYPTTYFIDSEGKVADRVIGYNEKDLRAALETVGIK